MRYLALAGFIAGCTFKPSAIDVPPTTADMAVTVAQDLSVQPAPPPDIALPTPDLAPQLVPDLATPLDMTPSLHYRDAIQGILDARGCTTASCHQAYAPLVIPAPKTGPQWQQNYSNVLVDVMQNCDMGPVSECASSSLLLNKPLLGSSTTHAGGVKPFASVQDPDYVLIFEWIEEGARL